MASNESNTELKRKLGLAAAVALSIGTTVGSGIFSSIQSVAGAAGSAILVIVSFLVGGLINIPANLVYAELATAYPEGWGAVHLLQKGGFEAPGLPLRMDQLLGHGPALDLHHGSRHSQLPRLPDGFLGHRRQAHRGGGGG